MPTQADLNDIKRYNLTFARTLHSGERLYSAPAHHEDSGNADTNEYFYRAMPLTELDSYRNKFAFDKVAGHQGWAPYRAYSVGYLSLSVNRLVEVYAPDFVTRLKQEGWFQGKIEKGCFSWGIGLTQSNGWQGRGGMKAKNKNQAMEPWDIFHETLKSLKVVNVLATP